MKLSLKELLAAKAVLDEEIAKAQKMEANDALKRVQELVTEFGFTSLQVFPLSFSKAKQEGAAKYRNDATGATWTGRGKPPSWIVGKNRDDFLIIERSQSQGPFLAEMAAAAGRNQA